MSSVIRHLSLFLFTILLSGCTTVPTSPPAKSRIDVRVLNAKRLQPTSVNATYLSKGSKQAQVEIDVEVVPSGPGFVQERLRYSVFGPAQHATANSFVSYTWVDGWNESGYPARYSVYLIYDETGSPANTGQLMVEFRVDDIRHPAHGRIVADQSVVLSWDEADP
jgi:hypothetical protein